MQNIWSKTNNTFVSLAISAFLLIGCNTNDSKKYSNEKIAAWRTFAAYQVALEHKDFLINKSLRKNGSVTGVTSDTSDKLELVRFYNISSFQNDKLFIADSINIDKKIQTILQSITPKDYSCTVNSKVTCSFEELRFEHKDSLCKHFIKWNKEKGLTYHHYKLTMTSLKGIEFYGCLLFANDEIKPSNAIFIYFSGRDFLPVRGPSEIDRSKAAGAR